MTDFFQTTIPALQNVARIGGWGWMVGLLSETLEYQFKHIYVNVFFS